MFSSSTTYSKSYKDWSILQIVFSLLCIWIFMVHIYFLNMPLQCTLWNIKLICTQGICVVTKCCRSKLNDYTKEQFWLFFFWEAWNSNKQFWCKEAHVEWSFVSSYCTVLSYPLFYWFYQKSAKNILWINWYAWYNLIREPKECFLFNEAITTFYIFSKTHFTPRMQLLSWLLLLQVMSNKKTHFSNYIWYSVRHKKYVLCLVCR